ncbi:low temperature requirement protein A [Rhodococcus gordoniae]
MTRQVRHRDSVERLGPAPLELFYDLVFVFTVTQVSHLLLEHLTWAGVGQAALVLLAVWWSWNFTTWTTNELDPESHSVRLLLIALMLASLLMAIAIPEAFEDHGLLFAGAYVAIQVGRHVFVTFVAAGPHTLERERAGRILIWFIGAGVFWIAGGIAEGGVRAALWICALALDYGAPLALFPIPGRRRLGGETWQVLTEHFAERFGLFVILALGETIVLTGATMAKVELTRATAAAFSVAFLGTAALWWLYFTSTRQLTAQALERSRAQTTLARDAYTYGHVPLVAAIILSAVGDELVIGHATSDLAPALVAVTVAGPALYLLAQAVLLLRATGTASGARFAGGAVCVGIGLAGGSLPALVLQVLLLATLFGVIAADEYQARKPRW